MNKIKSLLPAAVFLIFIYACFVLNIIVQDREFSEHENRALAGSPELSLKNVFDSSYMKDYESYITDQFFARDTWVTMKTYTELALGKTDVNGIFICKDDILIEKFKEPDAERVASNAGYIEEFAKNADVPVYYTLIPGAVELWADKLPANAQNASQLKLINSICSKITSALYIDTYSILSSHKDEAIFYKTDHHWTTLGAYYGYSSFADVLDITTGEYPEPFKRCGGFYGTASSACGLEPGEGDTIELSANTDKVISVTAYESSGEIKIPVYKEENLFKKDKYTVFFGGNYPLMVIKTEKTGMEKLLVIKDSYANSELPFMCGDFSEIHIVDLRYYKKSIDEYIEQNGIDSVLISYSVANFVSDTNLLFLTK